MQLNKTHGMLAGKLFLILGLSILTASIYAGGLVGTSVDPPRPVEELVNVDGADKSTDLADSKNEFQTLQEPIYTDVVSEEMGPFGPLENPQTNLTCPEERSGLTEAQCDDLCCNEHGLGGTLSPIGSCCFCGFFPGCLAG